MTILPLPELPDPDAFSPIPEFLQTALAIVLAIVIVANVLWLRRKGPKP